MSSDSRNAISPLPTVDAQMASEKAGSPAVPQKKSASLIINLSPKAPDSQDAQKSSNPEESLKPDQSSKINGSPQSSLPAPNVRSKVGTPEGEISVKEKQASDADAPLKDNRMHKPDLLFEENRTSREEPPTPRKKKTVREPGISSPC